MHVYVYDLTLRHFQQKGSQTMIQHDFNHNICVMEFMLVAFFKELKRCMYSFLENNCVYKHAGNRLTNVDLDCSEKCGVLYYVNRIIYIYDK
jgi:hypothetical protein